MMRETLFPFRLTPPRQLTFLVSVLLAIAGVVVGFMNLVGIGVPSPAGFLLLVGAYLVLLAGNVVEGM